MNNTTGASPKGDLPFLAKFDLGTKKNEIIWRCQEGVFEVVEDVIDADKLSIAYKPRITNHVPNYFIKNLVLRIADKADHQFFKSLPAIGWRKQGKDQIQKSRWR
jgi:hypothetical protein